MSFTERLNIAMKARNFTQDKLAKKVGMAQSSVWKLVSGEAKATRKLLEIATALDINPLWLGQGVGEMDNSKSNAKDFMMIAEWDSSTPLDEDEFEVPFFKDIKLAAGNGFADDIADYNNYKLRLSKSTMRRYNIDKHAVACLTVSGDSMEPVFKDGSTVGIDRSDINIRDGKIYAINHGGLFRVKVLENMPANQVKIKSYNTNYEDEVVNSKDIVVLGRVWWSSALYD